MVPSIGRGGQARRPAGSRTLMSQASGAELTEPLSRKRCVSWHLGEGWAVEAEILRVTLS